MLFFYVIFNVIYRKERFLLLGMQRYTLFSWWNK